MATLYSHQSSNITKTWILVSVFLVAVIGFGYVLSQAYGDPMFLYFAVLLSVVMNVTSYWFSDKIALAVAGAHPVTREEYFDLWNIVENLSITAGLPMPKVYVIDDGAPNAFATGRNKEHAVVAVTSGLLQILDRTELEGVIAHELSHIGNRDILLSSMVVVLVGFVTILSDFFLRSRWFSHRDSRDSRIQGIFFIAGIILAILSPIAATLIQLAISRKREFLADASGALLTRYPEGLASALQKISEHSRPMVRANNATAHLFIANPFGARGSRGGPGFVAKLFMTHPPVEDRVKVLRNE